MLKIFGTGNFWPGFLAYLFWALNFSYWSPIGLSEQILKRCVNLGQDMYIESS